MKPSIYALLLPIVILLASCARQETITYLDGTFRTTKPYAPNRTPPVYLETVFTADGTAHVYPTSAGGKREPAELTWRYTIKNDTIVFTWPNMPKDTLFDPPTITIQNKDTLRLMHDGRQTLEKVKK